MLIGRVRKYLEETRPYLNNPITPTFSPTPGFCKWAESEGIPQNDLKDETVRAALLAHYLIYASDAKGRPLNFVARVHLSNGAEVGIIWPQGDPSDLRMKESYGAMASYFYGSDARLKSNRSCYEGGLALYSEQVRALLKHPYLKEKFTTIIDPDSKVRREKWVSRHAAALAFG